MHGCAGGPGSVLVSKVNFMVPSWKGLMLYVNVTNLLYYVMKIKKIRANIICMLCVQFKKCFK